MIIDAGDDLIELTRPHLWHALDAGHTLLVVAMTQEMRYRFTRVVTRYYSGELDRYHAAILGRVRERDVRYLALVQEHRDTEPPVLDPARTRRLEQAAERVGIRLVGHYYVSPEGWCATGPAHTLAEHPRAERFPTVQVAPPARPLPPRRRRSSTVPGAARGDAARADLRVVHG